MEDRTVSINGSSHMALKAIFFDAAGTLFNSMRPVGETYASFARGYGMEVSAHEIKHRFHTCYASMPPLAFPGSLADQLQELERNWWKELVRRIFEPYGHFNRFDHYFTDLFTYFSKAESWSLYPETDGTLLSLKRRGLILVVISNFDSRVIGILEGLGIAPQFDSIVISSRVGYAKPQPEIFHVALDLHGLKKEEALHVGDSLENDIEGAARAGLRGVWLARDGEAGPGDFTRVRDLKEILSFIDRQW